MRIDREEFLELQEDFLEKFQGVLSVSIREEIWKGIPRGVLRGVFGKIFRKNSEEIPGNFLKTLCSLRVSTPDYCIVWISHPKINETQNFIIIITVLAKTPTEFEE